MLRYRYLRFMPTLSELLKSISPAEMTETFQALDAFQLAKGPQALLGDRLRVGNKFPAFASVMFSDHPETTTNPDIFELIFGYQLVGHWLGTVAEFRVDKGLEAAFAAVDVEAFNAIINEYQSQDANVMIQVLTSRSNDYPFLTALFEGLRKLREGGLERSGAWLLLFGVALVVLGERSQG